MSILRKILIAPFLGYFGTMTQLFEKRPIVPKDFGEFSNIFEYGKGSKFTIQKNVSKSGNKTTTWYGVLETTKNGKEIYHSFDKIKVKSKDGMSLRSSHNGPISNSEWYLMTEFTLSQLDQFWINKGELILNKNVKFTISGKLIHLDISVDDARENKLNGILV